MVAFDESLSGRDRAQLILVGAVAIAFIVMGIVVVFNTVLYTENVASTGSVSEPRDAAEMQRVSERGTRNIVDRIGTGSNWTDKDDLNESISRNVTMYASNMTNVTAVSSPAFLSFNHTGVSEWGVNVKHRDGTVFDNASATPGGNWTLAKDDARTGGFTATVKTSSLDPSRADGGRPFGVVWDSDAGGNYTVWLYHDSSGDVVIQTLQNETDPEEAYDPSEACTLSGSSSVDNVTIDFDNGDIEGYPGCSAELDVDSAIEFTQQRNISVWNGTKAAGQYSIVVDEESNVGSDVYDATGGLPSLPLASDETPYYTWTPWEIEFTLTYESGRVSFTDSYDMGVYNRSR